MSESHQELKLIDKATRHPSLNGFKIMLNKDVVEGHCQFGKTDIIAVRNNLIYHIEVKVINRTNTTRKRKKVKEQALNYASLSKWMNPTKEVRAFTYTNKGFKDLGEVSREKSMERVKTYFSRVGLPLRLDGVLYCYPPTHIQHDKDSFAKEQSYRDRVANILNRTATYDISVMTDMCD